MKKSIILCIIISLMLVGCGKEDKLAASMDCTDVGFIDTEEDAKEEIKKLDREDHLHWIYNQEKIRQLISLEQMLEEETKKVGGQISCEGDNLQKLMSALEKGTDTDGEREHVVQITVEMEDMSDIEDLCGKIDDMGYSGLASCPWNEQFVYEGVSFSPLTADFEEDTGNSQLLIFVPGPLLCYPKEYEEILQKLNENPYYVGRINCYGGAVNKITMATGEKNTLFEVIQIVLDQQGNVLEILAMTSEEQKVKQIKSDAERDVWIELLTLLTGDKNEAISFVNSYSLRQKKGTVAGKYNWTSHEEYGITMLRIQ